MRLGGNLSGYLGFFLAAKVTEAPNRENIVVVITINFTYFPIS
ncbi:hypothetical protein RintRC_1624 [Richelia intracellularis]|nr:hypothetical protein RintRC_1624 [Richelia intracellularis]